MSIVWISLTWRFPTKGISERHEVMDALHAMPVVDIDMDMGGNGGGAYALLDTGDGGVPERAWLTVPLTRFGIAGEFPVHPESFTSVGASFGYHDIAEAAVYANAPTLRPGKPVVVVVRDSGWHYCEVLVGEVAYRVGVGWFVV